MTLSRNIFIAVVAATCAVAGWARGQEPDTAPVPSDNCLAESCVGGCAADCDSLWTVRSDALFLHRSRPRNTVLVTDSSEPGATPLLNANEFDLGTSAGWDISLMRRHVLGTQWGVEGVYFAVDSWDAARGVVSSPVGAVVQFQTPLGNTDVASNVSGYYGSALHNVEMNLRHDLGSWGQFLVGFRYMDLRENGLTTVQDILDEDETANQAFGIEARNHLAGFQIGVDGHLWSRGRFTVDGLLKAGIYDNDASNAVLITAGEGPGDAWAAHDNHTAFVGDLALTGVYDLNDCWSVRAGYQLLWMEGVALASDQVAASDPAGGTASVATNGSPFYHGAFVGLEYRR